MQEYDEFLQLQGRLFHLANQIEAMQWEVARLMRETQVSNSKITALAKHLIHSETSKHLHESLAECVTQIETGQEKLDELTNTVKKFTRTQFKSNTLNESKEQQFSETLSLLRDIVTKHEEVKETQKIEEHQRLAELRVKARGELAADFLPVLDGINMALENGKMFAEKNMRPAKTDQQSHGLLQKLFPHTNIPAAHQETNEVMAGWLHGLEIVRDRCLRLLAGEGIEPIPDLGEQFDPHLHVAVKVEIRSDVPESRIVAVVRTGYAQHKRVLRYSEVIVAKPPEHQEQQQEE